MSEGSRFWKIAKSAIYTFCTLSVLLVAGLYYLASGTPSCDEGSEAVAYARSLSEKRLQLLYSAMRSDYDSSVEYTKFSTDIPEKYRDLKVSKIRPGSANIMVEGCFDHYVYLSFQGYEENDYDVIPKITLRWGEGPNSGSETLWIGSKNL